MQKEIMNVSELAVYLGVSRSKIYKLIREKKIPASKIGRQYKFSKQVVDAWLKENIITAPSPMPLFQKKKSEDTYRPIGKKGGEENGSEEKGKEEGGKEKNSQEEGSEEKSR
ncbi:MAG: helix-turn-helix domain-containing protein [Elusimicrobia bacterium]|nr:helix-turn-helix domain-containing protein [Elusimicrobiota bacterium]